MNDMTLRQVEAEFARIGVGVLCARTERRGECTASWVPADGVIRVVVGTDMVDAIERLMSEHDATKAKVA